MTTSTEDAFREEMKVLRERVQQLQDVQDRFELIFNRRLGDLENQRGRRDRGKGTPGKGV